MATRIDHQETRKLTAYGSIVLQLASKHPGGGSWRSYDRQFRQQKAAGATLPWAELNPTLMAATVLGQGSGVSWLCSLCLGCDHMKEECALSALELAKQGVVLQVQRPHLGRQATRQQAVQNPPGQARERPSLLHHSGHRWEGTAELRRDN